MFTPAKHLVHRAGGGDSLAKPPSGVNAAPARRYKIASVTRRFARFQERIEEGSFRRINLLFCHVLQFNARSIPAWGEFGGRHYRNPNADAASSPQPLVQPSPPSAVFQTAKSGLHAGLYRDPQSSESAPFRSTATRGQFLVASGGQFFMSPNKKSGIHPRAGGENRKS